MYKKELKIALKELYPRIVLSSDGKRLTAYNKQGEQVMRLYSDEYPLAFFISMFELEISSCIEQSQETAKVYAVAA